MKRVTEWSSIRLSRVTHSREKTGLVDVQVGDRLVDQDQPDLLADHRHLKHLTRPNDHRVISRVCRYTNFAVGDALEHDRNLVGLEQHFARFHGGTLAVQPVMMAT